MNRFQLKGKQVFLILIVSLGMVACQAANKQELPTHMASAVAVGALENDAAAGSSIPPTYTPQSPEAIGAEPSWDSDLLVGEPTEPVTSPDFPTQTSEPAQPSAVGPVPTTPSLPGGTAKPPTATPQLLLTNTPPPPTATQLPPTTTPTPLPQPPTATTIPSSATATSAPTVTPAPPAVGPVYQEGVLPVQVILGVVYGQGLKRTSWTEPTGEVIDLTLDIYMPPAGDSLRPSIMLYHGGGFQGGSSEFPNMVETAEYFAARGWVVFVVNYRLEQDYGSVPSDWPFEPGYLIYPAGRDAKAAVRWVHANAAQYLVSPDHITAMGGSAGGMISLMLGAGDGSDYRDELSVTEDPTLVTTNLGTSSEIQTVIVFWGSDDLLESLQDYDGRSRYDNGDRTTLIVHGSADQTIPVAEAERIYLNLTAVGVPVEMKIIDGGTHAAWDGILDDGRNVYEAAFDFMVLHQGLAVE